MSLALGSEPRINDWLQSFLRGMVLFPRLIPVWEQSRSKLRFHLIAGQRNPRGGFCVCKRGAGSGLSPQVPLPHGCVLGLGITRQLLQSEPAGHLFPGCDPGGSTPGPGMERGMEGGGWRVDDALWPLRFTPISWLPILI